MDSAQLTTGASLQGGKYHIERVLGQGGFGITYLATQKLLNRKVAIKEFFMRDFCSRMGDTSSVSLGTEGNRAVMDRYMAKFLKEAQTIAALDHPHIIRIYDIFQENNTAYYVMEYIEGESLSQLVKKRGPLPEEEVLHYIRAVASALKYVHQRHINHLDVKPSNIMVRRSDHRVFLLDFGLSKQYDAEGNQTSSTPVGISHGYAPMEQYTPGGVKDFSPQTDIYALGATLYYLLTGITPPTASDLLETELSFPATLSPQFGQVIRESMQLRKTSRPKDVDAFLALLPQPEEEDEVTVVDVKVPGTEDAGTAGEDKEEVKPKFPIDLKKILIGVAAAVVLIIMIVLVVPRSSGTAEEIYNAALEAYDERDYETAAALYRKAAEKGNANAQCNLGYMYANGEGVEQDDAEAIKWYRQAAEAGNIAAQYNLALRYESGNGVAQDDVEAVKWYRKAAEQGDADAQYELGGKYANGEGVTQDDAEAVEWYRKAAGQDHARAQCDLGYMYETGRGVSQDHVEAAAWYRKAAEQGNAVGQYNLGVLYDNGRGVELDDVEAIKWYRKAADQGDVDAQFNLGVMYDNGEGVAEDDAEAAEWYRKAAEQGFAKAQYYLGIAYDNGDGVAQDDAEAVKWYRKAAEQGYASAQNNLGAMYANGEGVAKDDAEAVRWYRKAAEQGSAQAQYNLGRMYDYGRGVAVDDAEAVEWYRKAAVQGHANAQNDLGAMYENGEGVTKNVKEAIIWYRKAAQNGSEKAKENLKKRGLSW